MMEASAVSVVIGGAGGIGSSTCRALSRAGFLVVVGYYTSSAAAKALAAELGASHMSVSIPITDGAALADAARRISDELGRCDVLVNCAGTTRFVAHHDLDGLDDDLFDSIMTTNVRGPFAAVRAFRQLLERSPLPGGGVVVNISSIAAATAMGSNVAYCASKAALDNVTRSLARALAPQIRVISISPGLVDTEFVQSLDQSWRDEQVARTPMGRLARPEEVADAVVGVVREFRFTTGAVIPVDGGRPLT
jgi:3-oxoacyl-[acyl-carrier protein] reductase